jgi:hypothetical protein
MNMMRSVDRERGENMYMTIIEARSSIGAVAVADAWLSRLTVWQQYLLATPFALIRAGIAVGLNSLLPAVDPNVSPF